MFSRLKKIWLLILLFFMVIPMKNNVQSQENNNLYSQKVRVTFVVTVPKNTPDDAEIYISGNHEILGNWNPKGIKLEKIDKYKYRVSFLVKKGTHLQFKFTRGDWKTVEKDIDFHEIPNRSLFVKKGITLNLKVENWADMGTPKPRKHTWVGNIKTHKDFYSKYLNNKRTIWVYLPPSYEKCKRKKYPVLYAHDGNNVFDRATAFLGVEWELDDTAEKLIKEKRMREIIIVAIENTPQRVDEYTHIPMKNHGGGKGDLYAKFIIEELKPFIDKTYRTLKHRQYTGIMGSSLGGLISLYIAWKYYKVFSMAGVVSPSVWWANRDIINIIKNTPKKPPIKIWLDIGTLEGRIDEKTGISQAVKDVRDLRDALLEKGFKLHYDLEYLEVEGGEHNEAAWAKRVDKILLFFFGSKTKFRFLRRFFRF